MRSAVPSKNRQKRRERKKGIEHFLPRKTIKAENFSRMILCLEKVLPCTSTEYAALPTQRCKGIMTVHVI